VYHNTTPEMSRRPSRGGGNLIVKSKHSKKVISAFLITASYIESPLIIQKSKVKQQLIQRIIVTIVQFELVIIIRRFFYILNFYILVYFVLSYIFYIIINIQILVIFV